MLQHFILPSQKNMRKYELDMMLQIFPSEIEKENKEISWNWVQWIEVKFDYLLIFNWELDYLKLSITKTNCVCTEMNHVKNPLNLIFGHSMPFQTKSFCSMNHFSLYLVHSFELLVTIVVIQCHSMREARLRSRTPLSFSKEKWSWCRSTTIQFKKIVCFLSSIDRVGMTHFQYVKWLIFRTYVLKKRFCLSTYTSSWSFALSNQKLQFAYLQNRLFHACVLWK